MKAITHVPRNQRLFNENFLDQSELREILEKVEKSKNPTTSVKINSSNNNELRNMTKSFIPNWEGRSVAKALEALKVTSKPDVGVSENNNIATPNLSEIPTFNQLRETQRDDFGIPASEVGAIINGKAERVYDNALLSIDRLRIRRKADEYGIKYDINNINFVTLPEEVAKFEELIIDAEESGVSIEQEIQESASAEFHHNKDARWDFLGSVL